MKLENFDGPIQANLEALERKRKELISQIKTNCIRYALLPVLVLILVPVLFGNAFGSLNAQMGGFLNIIFIAACVVYPVILCAKFYINGKSTFEQTYKHVLVKPLMEQLFPELAYDATGFVSEAKFAQSQLFDPNYTKYDGDDYFSGKENGVELEFSELSVIKSQKNSSSSNSSSNIFSGLFMRAIHKKNIPHRIIGDPMILFLENMQIPEFILNMIKRFMPNYGSVVQTGVPAFDNEFRLYCESEAEAKQFFTSEFIAKIIDVSGRLKVLNKTRVGTNNDPQYLLENGVYLKFSVVGNALFFAVFGYKLFDIKFGKSALNSKVNIKESVSLINMLKDLASAV